jgi:hypothetical protein
VATHWADLASSRADEQPDHQFRQRQYRRRHARGDGDAWRGGPGHALWRHIFIQRLRDLANQVFEREVAIYPVATGTAANALSLTTVSPPYGVVFCHASAHIEED